MGKNLSDLKKYIEGWIRTENNLTELLKEIERTWHKHLKPKEIWEYKVRILGILLFHCLSSWYHNFPFSLMDAIGCAIKLYRLTSLRKKDYVEDEIRSAEVEKEKLYRGDDYENLKEILKGK